METNCTFIDGTFGSFLNSAYKISQMLLYISEFEKVISFKTIAFIIQQMDFRCLWFLIKGYFSESTHWSPLATFHDAFCRCSGITEQHTYLRCSYTARCQVRIRPTPVSFVRPALRALSVFQKRLRIYFTAPCLWIVTYKDPKVRLYYLDMRFVVCS